MTVMKKILVVFGTRPEAIKMAPVIKELQARGDAFQTTVCVTAQHRQMLDQVLDLFEIQPAHDLNVMKADQDLFDVTSGILTSLKKVLTTERPDLMLVHGDTTTTMTASLAAFYAHVPVGHVEAGLRTGNKSAPFPEEINRKVTTCIADLHFAPTAEAKENLLREGMAARSVFVTGNTVIDALFMTLSRIKSGGLEPEIREGLENEYPRLKDVFRKLKGESGSRMVLVTAHHPGELRTRLREYLFCTTAHCGDEPAC